MNAGEHIPDAPTQPRVELFVRSLAPETARTSQETVIQTLRDLEKTGTLDSVEIHVAGECVCPSTAAAETDTGRFLLSRYETFTEWATSQNAELAGFRNRCVDSMLCGDTVTGISFPRLCMAVFDRNEIQLVAPVSDDGETLSVEDVLTSLLDWEE